VWIADWAWLALCCACRVPRGRPLARLTAGTALYASEMFLQLMTRTCRAAHPMKHYPNDMAVPYPSCIIPPPSLSLMKFIVILFLLFDIIVDVICTVQLWPLPGLMRRPSRATYCAGRGILLGGCSGSTSFQRPSLPSVGFLAHPFGTRRIV